jgi:hypothetical protein
MQKASRSASMLLSIILLKIAIQKIFPFSIKNSYHCGNNQFMAHSQLQKANESDKTMMKNSQALRKLASPNGTERIMPNMEHQKRDHLMMKGIPIAKAIQLTIQNNIQG